MSCTTARQRPQIADPREEGSIVCAVHGILTDTEAASWCDAFDAYAWREDPSVRVLRKEYGAGPVPALNVWCRNPRLARSLVNEVEEFMARGASRVSLVGHSNGCDVALRAARLLVAARVPVWSLVLLNAAAEPDVLRSGVFDWVADGFLYRAVAVSSRRDSVVRSPAIWPYGRLGFTGWTLNGREFRDHSGAIVTHWVDCDHNALLAPPNRERTFRWIWEHLSTA